MDSESNSITNQKRLLEKVAKEKGYTDTEIFIDDGITGTTLERPSFQRMIKAIEAGHISAVIVKEMLGLEWKDIDLNSGLVSVRRAAYQSKALGHYTDTPKSKRSLRTLKLPGEVLFLLVRYRDHQNAYAASLGDKWHETDRLFTAWDGSYLYTNAPERFYKDFCKKHGLRVVTLHSFRHLNASMLINAGLDVKTVQAALGHAHATTTMNTYAHEFQTAQARACDAVSNALNLNFGT